MKWKPLQLKNPVMHYEWGERGKLAYIPRLMGLNDWDETIPWAELWIGAHPRASSRTEVNGRDVALNELIRSFPEEILGFRVLQKFGPELPFLLKVLTAAEPLSIQAHPNAQQARELHQHQPEHYPDDRHKPEIAVALGKFECLVGIKPPKALKNALVKYHEIGKILAAGPEIADLTPRAAFTKLISMSIDSPGIIEKTVDTLYKRLSSRANGKADRIEELFLLLAEKYDHNDVGLLLIFLMNHLILTPGQAVYLGPGIPHAYISGAIIECMANSDNVVRVGLTPKHKDAKTLLRIADCSSTPSVMSSEGGGPVTLYETPASEFKLIRYHCTQEHTEQIAGEVLPIVLIVLEGKGLIRWGHGQSRELSTGDAILIPADLKSCHIDFLPGTLAFSVQVP